LELTCDNEWKV
jgi:DNA-binding Lrp family transcriptional regulator